jgi:hypothetical protein
VFEIFLSRFHNGDEYGWGASMFIGQDSEGMWRVAPKEDHAAPLTPSCRDWYWAGQEMLRKMQHFL